MNYREKCESYAQQVGIDALCELVPFTPEQIQTALASGDEHLNTLPLHKWDKVAGGMVKSHWQVPEPWRTNGKGSSLEERVSSLKHVARVHLADYLKRKQEQADKLKTEQEAARAAFVPQEPVDYEKQATDFLAKHGIKFRATLSDSKVAPWHCESANAANRREGKRTIDPHHYRVTLSKDKLIRYVDDGRGAVNLPSRLTFDFWASIADAEAGITTVTPYDVLACISSDSYCADTFKDWCADFGGKRGLRKGFADLSTVPRLRQAITGVLHAGRARGTQGHSMTQNAATGSQRTRRGTVAGT